MHKHNMGLLVKAMPFQVLEFAEGVILKRGVSKILVSGKGALERVLLILSHTSGKVSSIEELLNHFVTSDQTSVKILIEELIDKKFLVPANAEAYKSSGNQFDVFLGQFNRSQKNIIDKLSALNIVFVGINSINHSLFTKLVSLGVDNMRFYDDPILRNHHFIDSGGRFNSDHSSSIEDSLITLEQIKAIDTGKAKNLIIASCDFGGQALLLKWNKFCVHNDIDFLPLYLQDMVAYVGPLIIPGETACLQCLRTRQNAHLRNLDIRNILETNVNAGQSIAAIHPAAIGVLVNTAFFELTHFYGQLPFPRPGRLTRINLMGGETINKKVLKVPRCSSCSSLNKTAEVQMNKMTPLPK